MTTNTETPVSQVETPPELTTRESTTVEENRTLRHVMAQLWQAWANGQEPPTSIPDFPEITSIRSSSSQVSISDPFFPPGYGPFDNYGVGPSATRPQTMPSRSNPVLTTVAPVCTLPPPTVTQRATQEGQFTAQPEQGPGHNTDNCWTLKRAIEKLIDLGVIVVTDDQNTPNVTNNPLPAQNNVHLVGMVCDDQEYKLLGKAGKLFRKIREADKSIKSLEPVASLSEESVKLGTKVLSIPGVSKRLEVRSGMPKLYVSKGLSSIQQG
ncbi:hypothetical protein H5410_004604 [Solanum commersonii]|uniref:Uncharacterized protein n=1 Tax=Solanum commersonii TaxID=4109 RepID=A0A9J6B8V9_SOLCO|nr:hypothetical protein H5410_004604 [Solanum commersonii]